MVRSSMVVRGPVLYRAAWYLTFWSGNKLKKKKKERGKKELYKHPTVITLEPSDVGKPRWNPWAPVHTGCLASCTHHSWRSRKTRPGRSHWINSWEDFLSSVGGKEVGGRAVDIDNGSEEMGQESEPCRVNAQTGAPVKPGWTSPLYCSFVWEQNKNFLKVKKELVEPTLFNVK